MFSERIVRAPSFTGFLLVESSRKWSDGPHSSPLTGSTMRLPRGSLCAVSPRQSPLTFISAVSGFLQNTCVAVYLILLVFLTPLRQFNLSPKPEVNGGRSVIVVQLLSHVRLSETPWTAARQVLPGPSFHQVYVHWISDAIQPFHPLLPSSFAFCLFQHQGLFQCVISLHQVANVLELYLQHQSFQWVFKVDFP